MKPPKRVWAAVIIAALVVIAAALYAFGQGEQAELLERSDIVFINDTGIPIGSVEVSHRNGGGGGMNADGSPLERGAELYFEVNDGWPATLTLYSDLRGQVPLVSITIEEAPHGVMDQENCWYVIARDTPEGVKLALSLNLNERELNKLAKSISKNLGVAVTAGFVSYCYYPGHGWQGDGEEFVIVQFSEETAMELEAQLSAAEGWERFPVPDGLKDAFVSAYDHESHIDWDEISDSGWFHFRDEQEERHSAQSDDLYDSWDYVAAVYDAATRTLYFFEWHQ